MAPSLMSRAVRRALESSDWAASIFVERIMRDGIDMMWCFSSYVQLVVRRIADPSWIFDTDSILSRGFC